MTRRYWIFVLLLVAPLLHAATVHAFLDRTHVSLGDTVTLNIQSDAALGTPDLSALQKDFQILGSSRSSSVRIVNGQATRTVQLGIALQPLHAGTLTIPALDVGGAQTQALTLQVGAAPSGGTGKVGDPVFMQTNVQSSSPYVDQETVYTVRLFYLPGVSGALSDPTADGARLIKLDRDHRYSTVRDGYTYKVVERSWALIPQRSGAIAVQGPAFQGQSIVAGNPDPWVVNPNGLLNGQVPGFGKPVDAAAPVVHIDARAEPANAGKPWLPARDVQVQLVGLPANGKLDAGNPLTLTLVVSANGQPADALPEPELPPISGAMVYPDQTQDSTDDSGPWLQGKRARSFAIVPRRNGTLSIPAITLAWWNVVADKPEQATLPAHTLQVGGVATGSTPAVSPPVAAAAAANRPSRATPSAPAAAAPPATPSNATLPWRDIALASLVLWLLAMVAAVAWWVLRRRASTTDLRSVGTANADGLADRTTEVVSKPDPRALQRRALDAAQAGDAAICEHALLAWARALRDDVATVAALRDALSDAAQRNALDALQRARWQGGDSVLACVAVAQTFARGFAWRGQAKSKRDPDADLPSLYPS